MAPLHHATRRYLACPVQPERLLAPVTVADARQTVQHIVLVAGNGLAQAGALPQRTGADTTG
ncbi:hypothetical protein EGD00_05175 [Pectobacterium carotovorum subsp. carotovorum]|nr:hypothetical protein EGD00_05175 [Pectobacterium carotovorum subsp. carotovorum]